MGRRRGAPSGRINIMTLDTSKTQIQQHYAAILTQEKLARWASIMKQPLPVTFRIHGVGDNIESAFEYKELFINRFQKRLEKVDADDDAEFQPPAPIPWYPDGLAWQLNFSRKMMRSYPPLKALHRFIIQQHDEGFITRQEAVSMIPPFFLEIRAGERVLDMCAAPGSKTSQLLDFLHAENEKAAPMPEGRVPEPRGLIVANDASLARAYLLVRNVLRLKSPELIVTNNDASCFPDAVGADGAPLRYDKILADVPCSGDGTIRKSPDIWRRWKPTGPLSLHPLQLRIATRGAQLLRVGGRMVYSTCSLNPVEDEAVVATLVRRSEGALRLVRPEGVLDGLVTAPGLQEWRVYDKQTKAWHTSRDTVAPESRGIVVPSCFPQGLSGTGEPVFGGTEAVDLSACMRVWPWLQNTGGFFIAVLEKVAELPPGFAGPVPEEKAKPSAKPSAKPEEEKKKALPLGSRQRPWLEDPLSPVSSDIVEEVRAQFGFAPDALPGAMLMSRSVEAISKITLVSRDVAAFISGCEAARIRRGECAKERFVSEQTRLRVVNAGMMIFEKRQGSNVSLSETAGKRGEYWRIPHASLWAVRRVARSRFLGEIPYHMVPALLSAGLLAEESGLSQVPQFHEVAALERRGVEGAPAPFTDALVAKAATEFRGSAFVRVGVPEDPAHPAARLLAEGLFLSMWLGKGSFGVHLSKRLRSTLLQLLQPGEGAAFDMPRVAPKRPAAGE
eukprot:gnl/Chilomastix_cuspidata/1134.p1 GENE.gnl/Chilomastix_cuspidata/1134~~gnl/Chilomastix_cuspidata/1134.p1  ORF type:complete len:729 (-),score=348.69 gnl/Chilomastix_cuspidata/1134:73-2259(-)